MERRTDTGCEVPGIGDNSPMPKVAVVRSMEEQVAQLMQEMARLHQRVDDLVQTNEQQLRTIDRQQQTIDQQQDIIDELQRQMGEMGQQMGEMGQQMDEMGQQMDEMEQQQMKSEDDRMLLRKALGLYVSAPMTVLHQAPAVAADEPVAEESPLMAYSKLFVFSLRNDVRRSNLLVRMLREQLLPVAQSLERNTIRWCHVWKVLYDDQLLIEKANKKAFGRFLKDILGKGFDAENLRKASSGDELSGGNFHTWPEKNTDKNLCLEVEFMFIKAGIIEK